MSAKSTKEFVKTTQHVTTLLVNTNAFVCLATEDKTVQKVQFKIDVTSDALFVRNVYEPFRSV